MATGTHTPATLNLEACAWCHFPNEEPNWSPDTQHDVMSMSRYHRTLLGGLKEGGEKAMSKR